MQVRFAEDSRTYIRYKINGRYYVKCGEKKVIDGKVLLCDFINKREDRFKDSLKKQKLHICNFVLPEEKHNTLLQYYSPQVEQQNSTSFDEEGVKNHLAFLLGKKNISIDVGASDEFYNFIIYCIAYGIQIHPRSENYLEEAKKAYHHYKQTSLSQTLISISKEINIDMIKKFKSLVYCSISIDEGKTAGNSNLDFVLENPLSYMSPFPVYTEIMHSFDADGYSQHLFNGLSAINRYGIRIGSVVCDGNPAQKKAFSFQWEGSLRKIPDHAWLKAIVFIPCLCHRINCCYKNVIIHNQDLKSYVFSIRELGATLKDNKEKLGMRCPTFITTRWLYDYEIVNFLLKNKDAIMNAFPRIRFPDQLDQYFLLIKVLRILISIFESHNTFFFKAFMHLERALNTFDELIGQGVPCAEEFKDSLLKYTLHSEEGGLWILAYLFTVEGHNDIYSRILKGDMHSKWGLLTNEEVTMYDPVDPLEGTMNEMINMMFDEENDEEPENDEVNSEFEDASETRVQMMEEAEESQEKRREVSTQTESTPRFSTNYCDRAKKMLFALIIQDGYSEGSAKTIMNRFNWFIDTEMPFPNHRTEDQIGFSWKQIGMAFQDFKPIADVALKLLNSSTSEASCERTISAQRLIHTSRRRNVNQITLDARLSIMNASRKVGING